MQQINLVLIVFPALAVIFLLLAWRAKRSEGASIQAKTYLRLGIIFTVISFFVATQSYIL